MVSDKLVMCLIIVLLCSSVYTVININKFMKSEIKCESAFAVVSKCHCIPDDNLYKLFDIVNKKIPVNFTYNETE